jgi:hypothetical protein
MTRGSAIPSKALGYRLSLERGQTVVLFDAVQNLAETWGKDAADLLGLTIAHEIGHLLLKNSGHSNLGMMQARYLQKDMMSFERGHLNFSWEQIDFMRSEVRRRMSIQIGSSQPQASAIGGK